jgi:hypothetical protein
MKRFIIICLATFSILACKTNDKKAGGTGTTSGESALAVNDTANFTTIEWLDSTTKNLGKLTKDREIEISYRFKNTGTKNLVIENVSASCGCTIPEKPEKPFAPGEEGVIKAKFNGSGHGTISKQVNVIANTKPQKEHSLIFTGEINE